MQSFRIWLESEENTSQLEVRWLIRRDLPQVIEFAKKHPEFTDVSPDKIEEVLLKSLRQRTTIGIVAEHKVGDEEKIVGAMIYHLYNKHLEVPFITATNEQVYHALLAKLENKMSSHRRPAFYVRSHYDLNALKALKRPGYETKAQGDYVVGRYTHPDAKLRRGNWTPPEWDQWYSNDQSPTEPNSEDGDTQNPTDVDQYGLFKNMPWKDNP